MAFFFVCLEYMHKYISPNLFLSTFSSRMVQSEVFCFATTIFNKAWKPKHWTHKHTHTHAYSVPEPLRQVPTFVANRVVCCGGACAPGGTGLVSEECVTSPACAAVWLWSNIPQEVSSSGCHRAAGHWYCCACACVRCDACAEQADIPLCYNFCIFQKDGKRRKADGLLPICWAARSWDHFKGGLKYKHNRCMYLQK